MQYPSFCGANDHPYKGDPRQHALGTKLKNRVGSTFTIVGSSFRTSCGDSQIDFESTYLPFDAQFLYPMYEGILHGEFESTYLPFDAAHGPEAEFKPCVTSYETRIKDQKKASKAKDDVMRELFRKLNSSEAKTKELERAAAVRIDQDSPSEERNLLHQDWTCGPERACEQSLESRNATASSSTAGSIIMGPAVQPRRKRKSHHQRRREKEWKNSVQIPTPSPYD